MFVVAKELADKRKPESLANSTLSLFLVSLNIFFVENKLFCNTLVNCNINTSHRQKIQLSYLNFSPSLFLSCRQIRQCSLLESFSYWKKGLLTRSNLPRYHSVTQQEQLLSFFILQIKKMGSPRSVRNRACQLVTPFRFCQFPPYSH